MTTTLEDSTTNTALPATVTWVGTSGDWYDAANWSTGKVPTSSDIVTIENKTRGTTDEISFSNGNPQYGGLNLLTSNGGRLNLSDLTSYQGSNQSDITIEARGNGSLIDLSGVTSLRGGRTLNVLNLNALQGGEINFSGLTKISGGTTAALSEGSGSTIDFSELTEFIDDDFDRSLLKTRNGGFIDLSKVTKLEEVDLSSENSVLYLESLTTYVGDNNVDASSGGQISLIGLNSVVGRILQLTAMGARSRIVVSAQLDESEYLIQEIANGDVIVSDSSSDLNYPPIVGTPIPLQRVNEDQRFNFTIPADTFVDLDPSDSLSYTTGTLPSWLSFNGATRTFSGTPDNSQVGRNNITITASDGQGSVTTRLIVEVLNVNDAPTIATPLPDRTIVADESLSFTLDANTFNDVDAGDVLTYTATTPPWLSFDPATRTFSGTPTNADVGTVDVSVTATDRARASVTDTFTLTIIGSGNQPPVVVNPIADRTATEDQLFTFAIPGDTFTDPNPGTIFDYTVAGLPGWLTFDPATATFSGTPSNDDVGTATIEVTATDPAGATATDTFELAVANVNDPPIVVNTVPDRTAVMGKAFSYQVPGDIFTDIDAGDSLTYTATIYDVPVGGNNSTPLPDWLDFDPDTLQFSGTPPLEYGAIPIALTATDGSGASVTTNFNLIVDINTAQYGASYPDLIAALEGYDPVALSQHYRDFGQSEGRSFDLFDEHHYVASNPDLIVPIGLDGDAAAIHYIEFGFDEGRSFNFSTDQYIASYPDLIDILGYDLTAANIHYIEDGFDEERSGDRFDEYRYLAGYDDLLDALVTNAVGATEHFIRHGSEGSEDRDPLLFPSNNYIASYGDLIEAIQPIVDYDDYLAKLQIAGLHYVTNGRGEGRERAIFNPQTYLANNPDVATDPTYANDPAFHYIQYGYFEERPI